MSESFTAFCMRCYGKQPDRLGHQRRSNAYANYRRIVQESGTTEERAALIRAELLPLFRGMNGLDRDGLERAIAARMEAK